MNIRAVCFIYQQLFLSQQRHTAREFVDLFLRATVIF